MIERDEQEKEVSRKSSFIGPMGSLKHCLWGPLLVHVSFRGYFLHLNALAYRLTFGPL